MNEQVYQRLFGFRQAFAQPAVTWIVGLIAALLVISIAIILALRRMNRVGDKTYRELILRWRSWIVLTVILLVPVLLGAAWVMLFVCILSLLCYGEFARSTGLFREKTISFAVVIGILVVTYAVVDNFVRLFFACAPLTVGLITIITIPQDRPRGYIQRTAMGSLGFLLFGYSFAYLGYFANSPDYRPILILLVLGVELNDVFAYCCGKLIGGPKALPNTSPGKTWAGCIGAFVLTTAFVAALGHFIFLGSGADRLRVLLILGGGLSILGQFGDLLLSSIKRDVGLKDTGSVIPGHGGLLDRFDSLVLVPPAAFHFLSLYLGPFGLDQPQCIISGSL
jgi:phosphatidate cytidylyltransferase